MTNNNNKLNIKNVILYIIGLVFVSIILVFFGMFIIIKDINILLENFNKLIPMFLMAFFALLLLYIYQTFIAKSKVTKFNETRAYLIINSVIVLTVLVSCAVYSSFSAYTMPIASATLLIAILLSQRLAIMAAGSVFIILYSICTSSMYLINGSVSITQSAGIIVGFIASICMTFLVHRGYSRIRITVGGIIIGVVLIPLGIPFSLAQGLDASSVVINCLYCFMGSVVSVGLCCIVLPIYERVFRIWTDFRLAEICSLNRPLLKELKEKAPGTFSHALTVSILAEYCAVAIGVNPFMARACAMYHDIGKIKNPEFFVENQDGGYNPHDDLIIDVSVKMITKHPEEGAEILGKERMPDTIIKAAKEHHGDSTLMFFYLKAKGLTEGDLEADSYRYANPRPSTKYSAIIMICDMAEATIRAKKPKTRDEVENIVQEIIQGRILDGQFSDCDISLQDLHNIKLSICDALPSMLHERIDYNKAKERR